ncbi:MAG: TRAP transporter large permease subunit, partial [Burkholderiales bacterium]|nr:TRAP transporter large permease subunit [Burkholderiales bacterium]
RAPALVITPEQKRGLLRRTVVSLLPPLLLIIAVLGSIVAGIATPTESASVGAVGAIVLTLVKQIGDHFMRRMSAEAVERALFRLWIGFVVLLVVLAVTTGGVGVLTLAALALIGGTATALRLAEVRAVFLSVLEEVAIATLGITCMVFVLFLGASVFSLVFTRLGGEVLVTEFLGAMPGGAGGALFVVMAVMFVLGCFLDPFEIIFIVIPIAGPVLLKLGVDPIWLSILVGINLQTSYLTPPFGFSLFFLRGVAPPSVTTTDIYVGILPFVGIQIVCLAIVWFYPQLATWLPKVLYG